MDISALTLHEGTALYSLARWRYREVTVCGYFMAYGHRFLVVRDPHKPSWYTVIEEQTGRRISKDFCYRSVGIAVDRAIDIIMENCEILDFKVRVAVGLAERTFLQRNRSLFSPALMSILWK